MAIPLLVLIEILKPEIRDRFAAAGFELTFAAGKAAREDMIATRGAAFRGVVTQGTLGLRADEIDRMPNLEMIAAIGAGHENVDHVAAWARGIVVTHGPGTNDSTVADHAMALLLASMRRVVQGDADVRRGAWGEFKGTIQSVAGKRLGILGLGTIGLQIAKRAAAGFDMEVAYHNRAPRDGVAYRYVPTLIELATWCDILVVAAPGGPATRKLVDASVLQALGPNGTLVNIARGSIVDTVALIAALKAGTIAGAALDVIDGEPIVPPELLALPTAILTPHTAGRSPESIEAMFGLLLQNLSAHFEGRPVLTPVRG